MNEPLRQEITQQQPFIERQPIIDRGGDTLGYELYAYPGRASDGVASNSLEGSAAVLAHLLGNMDGSWLPEGKRVFLNADIALLDDADFLALLPDGYIVLDLHGAAGSVTEATLATIDELRRRDIAISLDGFALAGDSPHLGPELLVRAAYIKLATDSENSYLLYEHFDRLKDYPVKKIAKHVANGSEYKFCRDIGFDYFQGYFFTRPEILPEREMNTGLAHLVEVFDLVGQNAEPAKIEQAFKRDPTLVVKLLGYINSAGMSRGRKVTSIAHAIHILGYKQLYRWVALLLYTAGNAAAPAALMKTVLTRSRFIEAAGRRVLPAHEQDNLFMVGMLSMLDVVFGLPLAKALAKLPLPEHLTQAILGYEGTLGMLLWLAEALEQRNYERIESLSSALGLSLQDVNIAQLDAVRWAETLTAQG
jgi:EAL and modified HD-GYP domain-containing signal transduction protein